MSITILQPTDALSTSRAVINANFAELSGLISQDLSPTLISPAVDTSIPAGYSAMVGRSFKVAFGHKLTIGSAARFRIL